MNGILSFLNERILGKSKNIFVNNKKGFKINKFLIIFLGLFFLICVEPSNWGISAIVATENKQTLNDQFSKGTELFKDREYKEAIPIYLNLLENNEMAYSKNPEHSEINFRQIFFVQTRIAGYYRWILKNPNKAVNQYRKLITYLDTVKTKRNISFPIWLLMGEIYEKDLKEYEKANHCYEKAAKQVPQDKKENKANKALNSWLKLNSEKINIFHLKKSQNFSKRTLKYPSIDYMALYLSYSAFSEISFIEEDFMNYANSYLSIEKLEMLSLKYPNSYQLMSIGIAIFYHFLEENDFENALIVSDRLFKDYPYEINMIRLYFKIAEIYLAQNNKQEHHRYMEQGGKLAKSINVDVVLGPDTRFSSPEKTWKLFISLLEKNDLVSIAECFSPDSLVLHQNTIAKSKNRLDDMGSDYMQLTSKVDEKENYVEYRFKIIEKGKIQTYGVSFSNLFEEWKIDGLDLRFRSFLEWEEVE